MDDLILIHQDKEYIEKCLEQIKVELNKLEFKVNEKKTKIYELSKGIPFLGFKFKMTDSGKVLMLLKKDCIKRQKRHLRNLVRTCKKGRISKTKVDECFTSILAHASKGNTYYYIKRLKKFYKELW